MRLCPVYEVQNQHHLERMLQWWALFKEQDRLIMIAIF